MRVNRNRIYPYPIFNPNTDDYMEAVFETNTELSYNLDVATISFNIQINDLAISSLIQNQKLGICCHVECSKTKYRKAFDLLPELEKNQEINISLSCLNEDVEVICFLVAKNEIVDFKDENLSEFYSNINIRFPKYSVVGYSEPYETKIIKAIDVNGNLPSIFSVTTMPDLSIMSYSSDENKIYINLPHEDYQIYHKYKGRSQKIKQMMIVFPVLVDIISKIQISESEFSDTNWFYVLEAAFDKYDYDDISSEKFKSEDPSKLAQIIMPELSNKAFVEFDKIHSCDWRD